MRHPEERVLRRLLDEPAAVADVDRHHVAGCRQCLEHLTTTQGSAPDATPAPASGPAGRGTGRRPRAFLRRPAIAAVAVAAVLAGGSTAAAGNWFEAFRTEQVVPVSLSTTDLVALPDLGAYGDLEVASEPDVRPVPDAAAAAAATGLDVPEVQTLPRGVTGEPVYRVGDEVSATFTFSADQAAQAAADAGATLPPPPPGLDGARIRLDAGPGVVQVWGRPDGPPSLVVGRAVAPSAFSSGVPFETARDYLLSLPGLPDDVAAQLRTFAADGSTLPLPVRADQVVTSTAQVGGAPATVLESRDRAMAAVVWVQDGVVTAVVGALGADEVLAVARDLT